ncbi:hypothetical protein AD928_06725 [Acetobacter cerevisiae]|uniref:Uncharacterized protein n=1 Tax=Acetobacter cerevisiae TaxID=178900 RepID=A0A149QC58_9PROT|nr:hypothetical protein AD928_06725 [Acetobacter cerevisiae]
MFGQNKATGIILYDEPPLTPMSLNGASFGMQESFNIETPSSGLRLLKVLFRGQCQPPYRISQYSEFWLQSF